MAAAINQEVSATVTSMIKQFIEDDDAASTASGASSDQVSLPSSPGISEFASLPSSPATIASDAAVVSELSPETLANLPSLGSLGHFAGLCSRCCFAAKGRCQNGYNCRFCHFEHEKRQRKKDKVVRTSARVVPPPATTAWAAPTPFLAAATPAVALIAPPPGLEMVPFAPKPAPQMSAGPLSPQMQNQAEDFQSWSAERVIVWLNSCGLNHLSKNFEEHRIMGDVLFDLNSSDLEEIGITAFGDKKRVLKAISQLQYQRHAAVEQQIPCPLPPPSWTAPSFEEHSFFMPEPCPPPTTCPLQEQAPFPPLAPPPFMEMCYQCEPPLPPSFSAPM